MRKEPGRLVFVDETSVNTSMCRQRGRSPCGERLKAAPPFGKWHTQTFIAGLRCDSLVAPWVINGAMDGEAFAGYIATQLAPTLRPGDVVILDNLNVHNGQRDADAIRERGAWFVRRFRLTPAELPARSQPDRNGVLKAQGASQEKSRRVPMIRTFSDRNRSLKGILASLRARGRACQVSMSRAHRTRYDALWKASGDICALFKADEC